MTYRVIITDIAQDDFDYFLNYIIKKLKNKEAAKSLLDDFENTIKRLEDCAGSLKICDNETMKKYNYRRINFSNHHYFMLYVVENDVATVDRIFHDLQDFENLLY